VCVTKVQNIFSISISLSDKQLKSVENSGYLNQWMRQFTLVKIDGFNSDQLSGWYVLRQPDCYTTVAAIAYRRQQSQSVWKLSKIA